MQEPRLTYGEDLWDKFNEVMEKITVAKENIKELMKFVKDKADMEERLGKFLKKSTFKPDNLGQFEGPMNVINAYTDYMSTQHAQTSTQLSQGMYKELLELKDSISKTLKSALNEEKKLRNEFNKAKSALASAKAKEQQEKKDYEQLQIKLLQSNDLPPKKLTNLQNQVHNAEKSSMAAEKNYEEAYNRCSETRERYYQQMAELMNSLEELDRKRTKTMIKTLGNFFSMEENLFRSLQGQCEAMKSSFDLIDEERDVQDFIKSNKTGLSPPPMEKYDPYVVKIPDELNTSRFSVRMPASGMGLSIPSESSVSSPSPVSAPIAYETTSRAPATTSETVLATVVALFDYNAGDESEVSFKAGASINVFDMSDENGWWMGEVDGKRGYFPSNFVQAPGAAPVAAASTVKALYDYAANDAGELPFSVGDVITVLNKNADGWWEGECNGRRGIFPSNFTDAPDAPDS